MHLHNHDHAHHDHGHHGHGHHGHGHDGPAPGRTRVFLRFLGAGLVLAAAVFASCSVIVPAGQAVVVTRFGDLSRVLVSPGLAWKWPAPAETGISVDLRLRTTSTGLQDVGTKDGLRILVQAFVAWQVPADPGAIRTYLRAVREPDEAARQLRSLTGAALQVTASGFDLQDLVDTDTGRQRLPAFESRLLEQIQRQAAEVYGVKIVQAGIERLSLPDATLAATVSRMRAERETAAAARTAEGLRAAAELRSRATSESRILVAHARTEAAGIEAASRQQAAAIQSHAYAIDPELYAMLRSLDTLGSVVGPNTRMVLRTDSAPFNMLIGPPRTTPAIGAATASAP